LREKKVKNEKEEKNVGIDGGKARGRRRKCSLKRGFQGACIVMRRERE